MQPHDILNWKQVSQHLSGTDSSIRQNQIRAKYATQINQLLTVVQGWMTKTKKMTPQERITEQAAQLIKEFNVGWLQAQLSINSKLLKSRLANHTWSIDESNIINKYHEMFILEL